MAVKNPWGWQRRPSSARESAAVAPVPRRSLTPTFDRLHESEVDALADRRQAWPPGVDLKRILKEASLLWVAEQLQRQGRL